VSEISKAELRKVVKSRITSLAKEQLKDKSHLVCQNLKELLLKIKGKPSNLSISTIGLYSPRGDEVDLKELDLAKGYAFKTVFPSCEASGQMVFREATFSDLVEDCSFGVSLLAPDVSSKVFVPDICIVPGLAFSPSGQRLGRGKGFYDKFFSQYKGLKIGVAFEEQIFSELPCESHDVNVDYVVSESGILSEQVNINNKHSS